MNSPESVAQYYDRNTDRFLRFGRSGDSYAIHRPLWAPGVGDAREAANYINRWIAAELGSWGFGGTMSVLDMGCGVGGTLFQLADAFPEATLHGVTISPRQVELGERLRRAKRLDGRCHFSLADFHALDLDLEVDAALAVESFVHGSAPEGFLAAAAGHIRPGGVLIVVDDFLARPRGELSGEALARVGEFEAGWRLGSLCTVEELEAAAGPAGFEPVGSSDFTALIRLGRPRDRAIALLSPLLRRAGGLGIPFFANMIGGNALQVGLREGFLRYRAVVLRRGSDGGGR